MFYCNCPRLIFPRTLTGRCSEVILISKTLHPATFDHVVYINVHHVGFSYRAVVTSLVPGELSSCRFLQPNQKLNQIKRLLKAAVGRSGGHHHGWSLGPQRGGISRIRVDDQLYRDYRVFFLCLTRFLLSGRFVCQGQKKIYCCFFFSTAGRTHLTCLTSWLPNTASFQRAGRVMKMRMTSSSNAAGLFCFFPQLSICFNGMRLRWL